MGDQFQVKTCLHGMHEFILLKLSLYSAVAAVDTSRNHITENTATH